MRHEESSEGGEFQRIRRIGNTAQSVAMRNIRRETCGARRPCADVIAARFLKKVSNFRSAGDMKEVLKAANFKGFAVGNAVLSVAVRNMRRAARRKAERFVCRKISGRRRIFLSNAFCIFIPSRRKGRAVVFRRYDFLFCGLRSCTRLDFLFHALGRACGGISGSPSSVGLAGGGSAPLSRRSQPPSTAACGFSSSVGSVAYSFSEKSLFYKSFSEALFCFPRYSCRFFAAHAA